ncbi:MarR family winged helix-turn-helix transcriptional regulator [Paenibacillus sp. M1]|uniref:MarR family winged helix-turn-helix transcriptional regulator n=1 Tax=Paenibacillus haidiansis TaxID=1574488 RepID=A0ABU7VTD6_9BACL
MNDHMNQSNLIDLISDKHTALRKQVGDLSDDGINKTEAHILAVLEAYHKLSISEVARKIGISRQGTHKSIQGLLAGEYIEVAHGQGNERDKQIVLTPKGADYCRQTAIIKDRLERQIADKLGKDQVELLKKMLREPWL